MSMAWEITSFAVQTSTPGQKTDTLYANGRMQVPVIASIKAINGTTGSSYQLTTAELQKIHLIDYYSKTELTGTWAYSTTENEYSHTLTGTRTPVVPIDDGAQSIYFWVSATKVENKNIGARITQPSNTTVTTTGGTFNSLVTLTAIQPVVYTTSNVTIQAENTAKGAWIYSSFSNNTNKDWHRDWLQENHYVESNVHPILKADLYDYNTNGYSPGWGGPTLINSFAYLKQLGPLNIFYFWAPGVEEPKQVGVYHHEESWFEGSYYATTFNARVTIQVNQKKNAFCLTHMKFLDNTYWGKAWSKDAWFRLYDTYGNSGDFYAKVKEGTDENGDTEYILYLQNKNTAYSTELPKPTSKL